MSSCENSFFSKGRFARDACRFFVDSLNFDWSAITPESFLLWLVQLAFIVLAIVVLWKSFVAFLKLANAFSKLFASILSIVEKAVSSFEEKLTTVDLSAALLVIGGHDPLSTPKQDRAVIHSAAVTIICASIMAWISMNMLLSMGGVVSEYFTQLVLIIPTLWALVVFSFDRALVSSIDSKIFGPSFLIAFLVRITFAIVAAFVVALPLELKVFQRSLDERIEVHLLEKAEHSKAGMLTYSASAYAAEIQSFETAKKAYEIGLAAVQKEFGDATSRLKSEPPSCKDKQRFYCLMNYEANCTILDECNGLVNERFDCKPGARTRFLSYENSYLEKDKSCTSDLIANQAYFNNAQTQLNNFLSKDLAPIYPKEPKVQVLRGDEMAEEDREVCQSQGAICEVAKNLKIYINPHKVDVFSRMIIFEKLKEEQVVGLGTLNEFRIKFMMPLVFALMELMPAMISLTAILVRRQKGDKGV